MSFVYSLRIEFDLAALIRQINNIRGHDLGALLNELIQNRDYFLGASSPFHVLKGAIEYLMHVRDCVRQRVRFAGRRGRNLTEAATWLEEVERCILAFDMLRGTYHQIPKLFWASPSDFWRYYSVCKDASQMLSRVRRLCAEGGGIIDRVKLPQPIEVSTGFASRDHTLRAAIARVKDEGGGGVIGIWGRAGSGKTHLLKLMEKYFFQDDSFDLVLRITVPRDASISKVQTEIIKKLLLANCEGKQKKALIFTFLKERNFLLLVDCIWKRLDLEEVGVPCPNLVRGHRQKVVFTTCFSQVCGQMNVELGNRIEVQCFDHNESWEFFRNNSNVNYIDRQFFQINISTEFCCSPLELITIGRAMHNKGDANYWENALVYLPQSCMNGSQGSDTEEAAFFRLKLGYDSLAGTLKDCFKSCSLWPEGHIFSQQKLVEFWIGLGLLQGDDIQEAYNEGFSHIAILKELCLLESAEDGETVEMQCTIRDFALWIVHNQGKSKNKWKIQSKEHWGSAEQVLLVGSKLTELPCIPSHQERLAVLILQDNYLKDSSFSNFHSFLSLQYLDLSFNKFSSIPVEICMQVNLRYLNLSQNKIKTIPMELGCLTKLRHLHLRNNPIQVIPNGILPKLQNLEVLDICSFDLLRSSSYAVSFDELELMNNLRSLGITVDKEISCSRITKSTLPIRALCVVPYNNEERYNIPVSSDSFPVPPNRPTNLIELGIYTRKRTIKLDGIHSMWNLHHVEKAYMHGYFLNEIICQKLCPEDIFISLRRLDIVQCLNLTNVSWILHLPLLEDFLLFSCSRLHQIIAKGVAIEEKTNNENSGSSSIHVAFPRLKRMTLVEADRLVSICSTMIAFPSLECLKISGCPLLKKLPFITIPIKLKCIRGENEWWDGLDWEDNDLQYSLEPYFHGFSADDQLSEICHFNSLQVEWARIHEDFGE